MAVPVTATVARLLCRELTLQNEYLRLENRILREKIPGRLRFTDEERRSLVEAALAMGRSLMKVVVRIVKPETILAWQRRLERWKWDYSARRTRSVRKSIRHPPRIPGVLGEVDAIRPAWPCWMEDLGCTVLRLVDWRENRWASTGYSRSLAEGMRGISASRYRDRSFRRLFLVLVSTFLLNALLRSLGLVFALRGFVSHCDATPSRRDYVPTVV